MILIENEPEVVKGLKGVTAGLHMSANQQILALQMQRNASNIFLFPAGTGKLRRPALTGNEI